MQLKLLETNISSGSVPVSWCFSENEDIDLSKHKILLAVTPLHVNENNKVVYSAAKIAEWRGEANIDSLASYVTFYRPGLNRILAICVDKNDWSARGFFFRSFGKWEFDVLQNNYLKNEEISLSYFIKNYEKRYTYLDVDVPKECFASEPLEFEKQWVNFFFRNKAVDQCEFRKRRMLAYTVQPFVFLIDIMARLTIALLCTLLGFRKVNWKPVFSPLSMTVHDVLESVDGSMIFDINTGGKIHRIFLQPSLKAASTFPFAILVALIGFLGGYLGCFFAVAMWAFLVAGMFLFSFLITICYFIVIYLPITKNFIDKLFIRKSKKQKAKTDNYVQEFLYCSSPKAINTFKDLPVTKMTIKLRFQGLKTMVCRPFMR